MNLLICPRRSFTFNTFDKALKDWLDLFFILDDSAIINIRDEICHVASIVTLDKVAWICS
jgi:hypothetical protein